MSRKSKGLLVRGGGGLPLLSNLLLLLLLLLLALLFIGGCGKKMTPLSREAVTPATVREFRLSQDGDALVLSWLLPREDRLGRPLTQVQGCRLFRAEVKGVGAAPCPTEFYLLAEIDLAYPLEGEVQGERVLYRDRKLTPDRRYFYRVTAYDPKGYGGAVSQVLSYAWGVLPQAPGDLKAEAGDKSVRLAWSPVTRLKDGSPAREVSYRLYRRSGEGDWLRVAPGPVTGTEFQDLAVLNEADYTYRVRALRPVGPDWLESADSPLKAARPEDRTPPAPLRQVLAVPTDQGVELRWEPSPAPDLAGYRVYRRGPGQTKSVLLTRELLTRPYFVDAQVERGRTYDYYVTAVDDSRRANESLPSEETSISY